MTAPTSYAVEQVGGAPDARHLSHARPGQREPACVTIRRVAQLIIDVAHVAPAPGTHFQRVWLGIAAPRGEKDVIVLDLDESIREGGGVVEREDLVHGTINAHL